MGSHKMAGKSSIKTKNSHMASVGVIFNYTYHTAQVILWPTSPASNVVTYSQLADCPVEIEPFKDHPSTHRNE